MRFILPAIALGLVASPAAASANLNETVVTVRVDFSDIDLSTEAGRDQLNDRIETELRDACTVTTNARYGFGRKIVDQKCLSDARTAAIAEVERFAALDARAGGQVAAN